MEAGQVTALGRQAGTVLACVSGGRTSWPAGAAGLELAAGLADASAEAVIASIRQRQRSLLAAWHSDDAGTEELRIALQQYRTYWDHLEEFSRES